jgi:hypothetical protein
MLPTTRSDIRIPFQLASPDPLALASNSEGCDWPLELIDSEARFRFEPGVCSGELHKSGGGI